MYFEIPFWGMEEQNIILKTFSRFSEKSSSSATDKKWRQSKNVQHDSMTIPKEFYVKNIDFRMLLS